MALSPNIKSFFPGDTLVLKKAHPCGKDARKFTVLRVGSDIRMACCACGHDVTLPRIKLEKNIKSVIPKEEKEKEAAPASPAAETSHV